MNAGAFFVCQKLGRGRIVGNEEVGGKGDKDSQDTLKNKDPSLAIEATHAPHVSDALDPAVSFRVSEQLSSGSSLSTYPSKYTPKRTSQGRSTEEERDPVMLLLPSVPH